MYTFHVSISLRNGIKYIDLTGYVTKQLTPLTVVVGIGFSCSFEEIFSLL